jgi:hypothetical protein
VKLKSALVALLLALFVSGCASYGSLPINSLATAEVAGPEPEAASKVRPARGPSLAERERKLAALPKNSPEWWTLHNEMEADEDARLAKALIICHGCATSPSREPQTVQAQPLPPGTTAEFRGP